MSATHFNEEHVISHLKHYLPAQAPLKDFVHHNTLHAFQDVPFFDGIRKASRMFGYKTSLNLSEYRDLYQNGRISADVIRKTITESKGEHLADEWMEKMINKDYHYSNHARIGSLRSKWKGLYKTDIDGAVQPLLFRMLCSYLDQGIAVWSFPWTQEGFLASLRKMERNAYNSIFKTKRASSLLQSGAGIEDLLHILIGDHEQLFESYIYDQQFSHPGWSGMVAVIEDQPELLMDRRIISLKDIIIFELLLEIDALDTVFPKGWSPIGQHVHHSSHHLFDPVPATELDEVIKLWQESFEWSYFDQVLAGIRQEKAPESKGSIKSFQALFCIDDRECSFRRYVEQLDSRCRTFGTPGFFGIECYFQPQEGKFYTKVCPAPLQPKYLIKEKDAGIRHERDLMFTKHSHSFPGAWVMSQTVGFWSAFKLLLNIFFPTENPAMASSFKHMDRYATLTLDRTGDIENGLQIGFSHQEMADRIFQQLKSIGLTSGFASLVYAIGHGASSVNNPHYAAYDCGACSGKAGSVNARAFAYMANLPEVRAILKEKGLLIPDETRFMGGLHDTTRDQIVFFDEHLLDESHQALHADHIQTFEQALHLNAKERSRRFMSIDTKNDPVYVHEQILKRSVSLFEPRPELNHATNTLCIVGRRYISKGLFLDRRSFLNSYNYEIDPDGDYLFGILKAATPVCGGINLEYYFSRVDNQKLGAGSKLPHNVMGLFGVANGIDGDLRPGLPSQMIEVHDPLRLLMIVEHHPDVVLKTIQRTPELYDWYLYEWVLLVCFDPDTQTTYRFRQGVFEEYLPVHQTLPVLSPVFRAGTPDLEIE